MAPTRRTQADRSAATRALLVDAAVATLIDRGWAATTAVEVCARAGVTRGALLHHFPNLSALLAQALESLYGTFAERSTPADTLVGEIDRLWVAMSDRRFKAVLEAWMAAGNDADLAAELVPVIGRFAKLMDPGEQAPATLAAADARAFYVTAREALIGLALGRALGGGRALPHEATVLGELRSRAASYDEVDGARPPRARTPKGTR